MFLVTCDTGFNRFFLYRSMSSNTGFAWTVQRERAHLFSTRAAANIARRKSYKTKHDQTGILPVIDL